jgi:hypothetical protein
MNAADLDDYLERTVRFDSMSIPPLAMRDEDGPTVNVPAPAMAILAARSARSTSRRAAYSGYPPSMTAPCLTALATPRALGRGDAQLFTGRRLRGPLAQAVEDDPAMRRAVIGIWMVAAFLFATLGILVK